MNMLLAVGIFLKTADLNDDVDHVITVSQICHTEMIKYCQVLDKQIDFVTHFCI